MLQETNTGSSQYLRILASSAVARQPNIFEMIMLSIQLIEEAVEQLPRSDLAKFRDWFLEFDARAWDKQIEDDANAGKLDSLAAEALAEYYSGKMTEL